MRPQVGVLRWLPIVALLTILGMATACGGSSSADGGGSTAATAQPVATMPRAQFTAVAQQNELTQTATLTATTALSPSAALPTAIAAVDEALLARGALSYEKNKCGNCHGAKGEGITNQGTPIAATPLTITEFDNALRTGAGLGNTHIFGPSAISRGGMEALYAYVQSIK